MSRSSPPPPPPDEVRERQLHPLPRGLVELYGLLAVLFVLVPEWMAGGLMEGLAAPKQGQELAPASSAWRRLPELRLASMSLAELRELARSLHLCGYAGQRRDRLASRLLRRLSRRKAL